MSNLLPLTPEQRDLIHRGADGAVNQAEQAELRILLAQHEDAQTLHADLMQLVEEFRAVSEQAPPPRLRAAILGTIKHPIPATREEAHLPFDLATPFRWFIRSCGSIIHDLEERMARKTLFIGTFAVAAIAIIGYALGGSPPRGLTFGTIGAGDSISGVERASRYKGRAMDEGDVSLKNPEVQALFQNDKILKLVRSDAFRVAMQSDAFRKLHSSDAFRKVMNNDDFQALMANDAFRKMMATDASAQMMSDDGFQSLMAQQAFRTAANSESLQAFMASDAYRQLKANAAFSDVMASDAFRKLMANDAFRKMLSNEVFARVMSNEAFRMAFSEEAFRMAFSEEAFRTAFAEDAFREVLANDAFRSLMASDAFRMASRSSAAVEVFRGEAMRMANP